MDNSKTKNNQSPEKKSLTKEIRTKTATYILGAFGLVAALAWNDAIKALIQQIWPIERDSLWIKFIYAIIITIIVVIVSLQLLRFSEKKDDSTAKKN